MNAQDIFDQLDRDGEEITDFTAEDITDQDVAFWIRREEEIRDEWMDEEDYVDSVIELNTMLCELVRSRLAR